MTPCRYVRRFFMQIASSIKTTFVKNIRGKKIGEEEFYV